MKEKLFRMFRSGMAMLLAICMVVGMFPGVAFAEEAEKETVKLVSLGDSMTNGYGLDGYNHNSGVADYATVAYPNQFANALAGQGYEVDHAQLAMSGIRTEDIHWLLEFDYNDASAIETVRSMLCGGYGKENWNGDAWVAKFPCGDFWTLSEICNHSRTAATFAHIAGMAYESYEGCTDHNRLVEFPATVPYKGDSISSYNKAEMIAVIAKYYQEQVAAANVITLSVGNGNLGVFGFGRIMEVVGFSGTETYKNYNYEDVLRECEPEMKAQLMAMIDEIKPTLAERLPDPKLEGVVLYIAVSLAMNYAGTVDAILQMNSDVDIVLIPVMNTFGENYATVEGEQTIGDLLGTVVTPLNKFIAGLPAYMQMTNHEVYEDATFYWADLDNAFIQCMVDTYGDDMSDLVRDRFVESIVGYCDCGQNHDAPDKDPMDCPASGWNTGMVWGMLGGKFARISLSEIQAYESKNDMDRLAYAAGNADKAAAIAMYLAFEQAIIEGKDNPVTLSSVLGLKDTMAGGGFDEILKEFEAQAAIDGAEKLDVAAEFVAGKSGDMLTKEMVLAILAGGEAADQVYTGLALAGIAAEANKQIAVMANEEEVTEVVTAEDVAAMIGNVTAQEQVAYKIVAHLSGGQLSEEQVATLDTVGVDAFACAMVAQQIGKSAEEVAAAYGLVPEITAAVNGAKELLAPAVDGLPVAKAYMATAAGSLDVAKAQAKATVDAFDIPGNVQNLCKLLVTPNTLCNVLVEDVTFGGLLALFARCVIGNGLGAHPSAAGHNTLAAAVIGCYGKYNEVEDSDHTADKETDDNIDFEQMPVLKKIISDLTAQGLLNDDQILEIAFVVYDAYKGDNSLDGDLYDILDTIYNVLFQLENADELSDADRLAIVSIVYLDLKEAGLLSSYGEYLDALEEIVSLPELDYIPDQKSFAIVDAIYACLTDDETQGELSDAEITAITELIYVTLFKGENYGTAGEKLAAIGAIYDVLKKYGYLNDENGSLPEALKLLEQIIALPELEKVSDEQAFGIFEHIVAAVRDGDLSDEETDALIDFIYDEVLRKSDLTDGDKLSLTAKLYNILKDNGNLDGYDTEILEKIVALEELEYLSDAQVFAIVDFIAQNVLDDKAVDEEEILEIANFVYNTVFKDDKTVTSTQKLAVVVALYNVLKEYGYLENVPAVEVLEEVVALEELNYLSDDEVFAIVDFIAERVLDDLNLDEEEIGEIVNFVYDTVFHGDATSAEKLAAIKALYAVLDKYGYLENVPALDVLEEVVALEELSYLSDDEVFAIVDFIAERALDDFNVDEDEISEITAYIYETVFHGDATAAEKLAAIEALYAVLEKHGFVDTNAIPALKAAIEIYTALTAGEGEEQLISDEKMFSILDKVITAVLENNGQITEETAKELATEIVNEVFLDSEVSTATKAEIVLVIYNALRSNGLITDADIQNMLVKLAELLVAYGPDIAEGVYNYAEQQGYIEVLEAAIAELEDALEKKLASYADIVMPEIEDAITNLEAELVILRDELAELKAELEIKKAELEVLRGEVAEGFEDTFAPNAATPNAAAEDQNAVESAIAALEEAIATLEATIAHVEEKIAQIENAIAELKAMIETINTELMELVASVEEMIVKVTNLVELLKDAAVQTVEAAQDIYVEARDVAVAAVNVVKTAYEEAIDVAGAFVVLAQTINKDVNDLFTYAMEQTQAAWDSLDPAEQELIKTVIAELTAAADAKIAELYAENEDEIAAFEAELAAAKDDLAAILAVIEAEIAEKAAEQGVELGAELDAIRAEVEAAYAEAVAEAEAKIAEIEAGLAALNAHIQEKVAVIRAELEVAIAEATAAYNEAVAQAAVALEALKAHLEEKLPIAEAYAAVAVELVEALISEVETKVMDAIAAFEAAFVRATTDDYVIYADSNLVAIGDDSAEGDSYVASVAEALGVDYTNLAAEGTIADAFDVISENAATIAGADIITVGYGNNVFTKAAVDQLFDALMGNATVEYDWTEFVGEEGVQYVEQVLAEIEAYLSENGMDQPVVAFSDTTMAEALTCALEAYAYGAVTYACYLPEVVNAIHSVNPDAVVVVVGMNNPFEGAVLSMEGTEIALGDYVKYLVDGADLHGIVYSMLSGNCIYVTAPHAETGLTNHAVDATQFVMEYKLGYISGNPTEAGHAYITEQILNALNVSCGHDWTEWTVTVEPTIHTEGEKTRTCRLCGAVETQAIPVLAMSGLYRLKGADRYQTGLAVANEVKALLGVEKFETVIVAYGEKFPDALTGSYLAAEYNAPILLTDKKVDLDVLNYIEENVVAGGKVFILGGTAAVSQNFENGAKNMGFEVERLKGADRYATNLAILNKVGVDTETEILIATGNNYADSLSASATGLPMLLVNKSLTAEQKAFLEGTSKKFVILGGTAAVSESIENELKQIGTVERVKGASRYETSVVIAERYFSNAGAVVLAYGEAFPDGLCGGPLATLIGAPVVLTHNDKLAAADAFVEGVNYGYVTGGTGRLTDETVREIFDVDASTEIIVRQ